MKRYFFPSELPFMHKLSNAVVQSWQSLGSVACKINEVGENKYEVMFFPAVREVHGGKNDGEQVYSGFNFNIGKFAKIGFDEPPRVHFDCLRRNVLINIIFEGIIDGKQVKVAIVAAPPTGQRAIERIYATGPKKGLVEEIQR